jgi:protein transport protein SEC13
MDYYGRKLATCSSDKTVRIFEIDGDQQRLVDVLRGHDGPVWQVAWAHPKFGNVLASCGYDGKVVLWRDNASAIAAASGGHPAANTTSSGVTIPSQWVRVKEHVIHEGSVNSIAFAPPEYGLILACGSSDGRVSLLTCKEGQKWDMQIFQAHAMGVHAVSWAPITVCETMGGGSSAPQGSDSDSVPLLRRLATGGCDNLVRIWCYSEEEGQWKEEGEPLEGHTDWVRDVAWAPNLGLSQSTLASCSQDKTVLIWTQDSLQSVWTKKLLKKERFADTVWKLSWSVAGTLLAVSSGDNKVSVWRESLQGEWECLNDMEEAA